MVPLALEINCIKVPDIVVAQVLLAPNNYIVKWCHTVELPTGVICFDVLSSSPIVSTPLTGAIEEVLDLVPQGSRDQVYV